MDLRYHRPTGQSPIVEPGRPPPVPNENLEAAAAYAAALIGFPVVAPVVLYALRRDRSRFIAFHAAQAGLIQVVATGISWIVVVLFHLATAIVMAVSRSRFAVLELVTPLVSLGGMLLVPAILNGYGAYRAYQGAWWRCPALASIADRFVPPPAGGPPDVPKAVEPGRDPASWSSWSR